VESAARVKTPRSFVEANFGSTLRVFREQFTPRLVIGKCIDSSPESSPVAAAEMPRGIRELAGTLLLQRTPEK